MGATQGTKAELEEVLYWTAKGKLKPLIVQYCLLMIWLKDM